MSWDTVTGRNHEGYPDPTAATAIEHAERSLRGMRSRVAGEHFEAMIEASLGWYLEHGVACIEKTPEPMKPLRPPNSKGQFVACYTKAAQPDYKGTLIGGRSCVFEAKYTDDDQIKQDRVTKEQKDRLELHYRLGAAAFVLVSFGLTDFYRIPWEVWRNMKNIYGRKYLKEAELEPYRVQYISGIIKLLEGIELEYHKKGGAIHEERRNHEENPPGEL